MNTGEHAQGILLEKHDRWDKYLSQVVGVYNNRDQSFGDVNWQREREREREREQCP